MSEDNKNSEPFDFNFESLTEEQPPINATTSAFDLDNPFGDDQAMSNGEAGAPDPFHSDSTVLGDSAILDDAVADGPAEEGDVPPATADAGKAGKKKGLLGGLLGGKKDKAPKEKPAKEKKEKVVKEKKPAGESVPKDWGTILCITFSVFLFASLLMFNIAALVTSGKSIMQTLCFIGAIDVIGLAAAAVPILFYKFPQERTLPNVMLGVSAVAILFSLQIAVIEFSRYSFIMTP